MFVVDIDGTIAVNNHPVLIELCNRYFKLNIDPLPEDWDAFLAAPEVIAYRASVGEKRWKYNLKVVKLQPDYQRALLPIDGALRGVRKLLDDGLWYATCRKIDPTQRSGLDKWNEGMVEATVDWLAAHQFPEVPVIFCVSFTEKLAQVARLIEEQNAPAILIDDAYQRLLSAFSDPSLSEHAQNILREQCTIGALWAESAPESPDMATIAIPEWSAIEQLSIVQAV